MSKMGQYVVDKLEEERMVTTNDYAEIQNVIQALSPQARTLINTLLVQVYQINPENPQAVADEIVNAFKTLRQAHRKASNLYRKYFEQPLGDIQEGWVSPSEGEDK